MVSSSLGLAIATTVERSLAFTFTYASSSGAPFPCGQLPTGLPGGQVDELAWFAPEFSTPMTSTRATKP